MLERNLCTMAHYSLDGQTEIERVDITWTELCTGKVQKVEHLVRFVGPSHVYGEDPHNPKQAFSIRFKTDIQANKFFRSLGTKSALEGVDFCFFHCRKMVDYSN